MVTSDLERHGVIAARAGAHFQEPKEHHRHFQHDEYDQKGEHETRQARSQRRVLAVEAGANGQGLRASGD